MLKKYYLKGLPYLKIKNKCDRLNAVFNFEKIVMSDNQRKLGIIAGGGSIPQMLIEYVKSHQIPYFVLAIEGNADRAAFSETVNHKWIRIGQAGTGFKYLKDEGVQDVVMIGTIHRPTLSELVPDLRTAAFFTKIGLRALGDDGILRALVKEIESENMKVVGVHEIMPDLLTKEGVLTKAKPDKQALADIARGIEVDLTLGALDVGQSVVVQQGLVLGVEGIEGTDELIKRCGGYSRKGVGGVLVKLRKTQQDMRIDLPTIGTTTIENAHKAGLRGIAVHAGNALIVNENDVIKLANKYKMFVMGVNPAEKIK